MDAPTGNPLPAAPSGQVPAAGQVPSTVPPTVAPTVSPPLPPEALIGRLDAAIAFAEAKESWYRQRKFWWQIGSVGIRGCAFVAFAIGSLAPLFALSDTTENTLRSLENGYIALGVAAVVLAADRLFLVTGTWGRYVDAEMAIRHVRDMLDQQRAWLAPQITAAPALHRGTVEALCDRAVTDIREIMRTETATWTTTLQAAIEAFVQAVNGAGKTTTVKLDAALAKRGAAPADPDATGHVEVALEGQRHAAELAVTWGAGQSRRYGGGDGPVPASLVIADLRPGRHVLRFRWTLKDADAGAGPGVAEHSVLVKANDATALKLRIGDP